MSKGKQGVSMGSIMKPTTAKERADHKARVQSHRKKYNKIYGSYLYRCSNCKNRIRSHGFQGRKVLCSVCNEGFYERAKN